MIHVSLASMPLTVNDKLLHEKTGHCTQYLATSHWPLIKHHIHTNNAAPIRQPMKRTPKGFEVEDVLDVSNAVRS